MLREALQRMGRSDLIGNGKKHLVPTWQPKETSGNQSRRDTPTPTRSRPHTARATAPAKRTTSPRPQLRKGRP